MPKTETIALFSAVIALFAAVVSLANFGVVRSNLAFALFKQRMEVYESVRQVSTLALRGQKAFVEGDGLKHAQAALNNSLFLFGSDVQRFLNELWNAAIKIQVAHEDGNQRDSAETWATLRILVDATTKVQPLLSDYMAMDQKLPWWPIRRLFA